MQRLRESFIVREVENQATLDILRARALVYSGGQGMSLRGDKEGKIPTTYYKMATSAVERMIEISMPWLEISPAHKNDKSRTIEMAQQFTEAWEARFGKIDSPENLALYEKLRKANKSDGKALKECTRDFIQL